MRRAGLRVRYATGRGAGGTIGAGPSAGGSVLPASSRNGG